MPTTGMMPPAKSLTESIPVPLMPTIIHETVSVKPEAAYKTPSLVILAVFAHYVLPTE